MVLAMLLYMLSDFRALSCLQYYCILEILSLLPPSSAPTHTTEHGTLQNIAT